MLAAHLVPGYLAAAISQPTWEPEWRDWQRFLLWVVALGSTVAPDLDVVYNALFRDFFNHSTLWTHSLFVYLGIGCLWFVLGLVKRWRFVRVIFGLATFGGMSHLVLDVVAHGTPLFYPVSMTVVGIAPKRVIQGGLWAYLTDPIFLLEPLLFGVAVVHWAYCQKSVAVRRRITIVVVVDLFTFTGVFIALLPRLQAIITSSF